jgi:serine/threonine protein kinase
MLSGERLFKGNTANDTYLLNRICDFQSRLNILPSDISKESLDFLMKILEINPEKRFSAHESLQHPWFSELKAGIDVSILLNKHLASDKTRYDMTLFSCPNSKVLQGEK